MIDIREALDAAAEAGDNALTDLSIGRPAISSQRRISAFRNSLKRFCEALPADVCLSEILEAIDNLEGVEDHD